MKPNKLYKPYELDKPSNLLNLVVRAVAVLLLVIAFMLPSLLKPTPARAVAIASTGAGGNWNSTTTWSPAQIPSSADAVTITSGSSVTVDVANAACSTIVIEKNGTISFNNASQLTVVSSLTINQGIINMTSGGSLQIGGTVIISKAGTWTAGTGTIAYNAAGAQTVNTSFFTAYNNLTLSGSGVKTTTGATVNGILSMEGTATASAAPTYGAAATLQYNTATERTVGVEWITPFTATGGVVIANTGVITADAAKVFNASVPLTINSGAALAMSTFLLTLNGNLVNNGGTTSGSGGVTIAGTATQSIGAFTNTGTVSMTKTAGTATFTGNVNGGALTINGSGGTLNLGTGLTHTFTGTWTRTNGTLDGGSSTLNLGGTVSGTGGTFTASTGTINYNGSAQAIAAVTYNNLTINQSSGNATLGGAATVNGVLTLTAGNLAVTDPYELTMGASATTVGATDVTGIVTRTSFVADTSYTFGNQYTTINFQNVGTLPTAISIKITIGSAPSWKTGAVQRTYDIIRTGGSGSFATINLHYLDAELNGNTENKLVLWDCDTPFTPGTAVEYGRSNYDTANNWVGISSLDTSNFPTAFGSTAWTLGDSTLSNATWKGSQSALWTNKFNWTPNGVPSDLSDVVIPDAATTTYDPTLSPVLAVGRLTIESGGILNASADCTITVSGGSGAWSDNGTFNASTSTVIFTNAIATVSGSTSFYNVTINSGAGLTMGSNGMMRVSGTMTNNGTWPAAGLDNATVDYNGGSQTVLNPNGVTPGYVHLILSGSGTKTMPGSALNIGGNFTTSGTASVAPANSLTIDGNATFGSGTTFTGGAYTHNVAGDWTNNVGAGTVTLTGTTINFNGTSAQAIGGDTTTAFNSVTVANTSASVSANTNFSAGGTLTVNSSAILSPAAGVIVSGGGTLTGNGTVNVTRTAATADFSSQYTISNKTLSLLQNSFEPVRGWR